MKRCCRCKIEKSTIDFYKKKYKKDGFSSYCKPCYNIVAKRGRLKEYGLSESDFEIKKDFQNQKCKICLKSMDKICVDHDHTSKRTRGLLCNNCNTGLGLFKDNPDTIFSAIKYLIRHNDVFPPP